MKWTKVSWHRVPAYREWVDVFFHDRHARFSLLRIEQNHEWQEFYRERNRTYDDAIASAFHQFLLVTFGPLRDTKRWWVYPDANLFTQPKVLDGVKVRFNRTYKKAFGSKTSRIIRFADSRDSSACDLTQLADVLLGASSFLLSNSRPQSTAKRALVDHCMEELHRSSKTERGRDRISAWGWVDPSAFDYDPRARRRLRLDWDGRGHSSPS
jgi:hypothetical protein